MNSSRPYLLRALYEWILDNNYTPYITIDADIDGVAVPTDYIHDKHVTFNVSPHATKGLRFGNDAVEFRARFGSGIFHVFAPISAVIAIFAQENNQGMYFAEEDFDQSDADASVADTKSNKRAKPDKSDRKKHNKPVLKLIKGGRKATEK